MTFEDMTHAILALDLSVAFAPQVCREIAFVLVIDALDTLTGHLGGGSAAASGAGAYLRRISAEPWS